MVADLFNENFNLFLLCPNGQHETHQNCDKTSLIRSTPALLHCKCSNSWEIDGNVAPS